MPSFTGGYPVSLALGGLFICDHIYFSKAVEYCLMIIKNNDESFGMIPTPVDSVKRNSIVLFLIIIGVAI